ncbi:MAG: hypothetical protein DWQ51_15155 [Microcystis wesenbergii TW10]|jgi:hypothetical protein|uniref:Uncharacterized protein n=2 Tax=Microcystis TaxID=1125 RepID=A0A552AAA6_MICAE|nr:MAG: hypothetical protein DWQ51_15155 [Microcystis wesenbergii TW10]TRT82394.1 MAG: hypothetical protein EWV63_19430 [Microcystis aeruginosa Ma_OC_H_19870700_S124]
MGWGEVGCGKWEVGIMNYELGRWGSGEIEPKPQHPNTPTPKTCLLSPEYCLPTRRILTSNPMLVKDNQKLSINSKNLRIFKLIFRNIYKFLRIN